MKKKHYHYRPEFEKRKVGIFENQSIYTSCKNMLVGYDVVGAENLSYFPLYGFFR